MAHLTEGVIISEIRGSIGSRTFSKNAYGPYVKKKLVQTNPNTGFQITARQRFADAVALWQNYSQVQRQFWHDQAKDRCVVNSLGKRFRPTGYNLFIGSYCNRRLFTSQNPVLISPTGSIPSFLNLQIETQFRDQFISGEFTSNPNTVHGFIYISNWFERSINSLNPSWPKPVFDIQPGGSFFIGLQDWYFDRFGAFFPTDRITNSWVVIKFIDRNTGIGFGQRTFKFNPTISGSLLSKKRV